MAQDSKYLKKQRNKQNKTKETHLILIQVKDMVEYVSASPPDHQK